MRVCGRSVGVGEVVWGKCCGGRSEGVGEE